MRFINSNLLKVVVLLLLSGKGLAISASEKTEMQKLLVAEPVFYKSSNSVGENASQALKELIIADSLFMEGEIKKATNAYVELYESLDSVKTPWRKIVVANRLGFCNLYASNDYVAERFYKLASRLIKQQSIIQDTLAVLEAYIFSEFLRVSSFINVENFQRLFESYHGELKLSGTRACKYHFLLARFYKNDDQWGLMKKHIVALEQEEVRGKQNSFWDFYTNYIKSSFYIYTQEFELAGSYLRELNIKTRDDQEFKYFRYIILTEQLILYPFLDETELSNSLVQEYQSYLRKESHPSKYKGFRLLSEVWLKEGHYDKQLENLLSALHILESNNIKDERLANLYYNLGAYYTYQVPNDSLRLSYYLKSYTISQEYEDERALSFTIDQLMKYYYSVGDFITALNYSNLILSDLDSLLQSEDYLRERQAYLLSSAYLYVLNRRGVVYYFRSKNNDFELNDLLASYEDFLALKKIRESLYKLHWYEGSQISGVINVRKAIANVINAGYEIYLHTGNDSIFNTLFQSAEDSKSLMLKKYIVGTQAKKMAGVSEEEILQSKKLKREIDSIQYIIFNEIDDYLKTSDELAVNKLKSKTDSLASFEQKLKEKHPKYRKLMEEESSFNLKEIQNSLQENQVLIEYLLQEKHLYIFFVDKDTLAINYQYVGDKNLRDSLQYLQDMIINFNFGDFGSEFASQFESASNQLYDFLIKPFEKEIAGKRLLIVPDGLLSTLPFELLVSTKLKDNEAISFQKLNYLVKKNSISYLYSARQCLEKNTIPEHKIRFVGFAPEYHNLHDISFGGQEFNLPALPGAKKEIQSGLNFFHGKAYSDESLTKEDYFRRSRKASIIHLAMHTLIDKSEPMNSMLLFSNDIENTEKQLKAYEVYSRNNNAKLVLLSACNTGVGKIHQGEGVFSLARAFLLAGFNNVIYTQWPVADKSGAAIINKYYEYLAEGYPSDIALQKARIEFLENGDPVKAHPYFWAAYVQTGNPVKIEKIKWLPVLRWTPPAILIVLLLYFLNRKYLKLF